jgi:hypothetical protein
MKRLEGESAKIVFAPLFYKDSAKAVQDLFETARKHGAPA